jgi:hypothetical protein
MKKLLALLMAGLMVFALCSCTVENTEEPPVEDVTPGNEDNAEEDENVPAENDDNNADSGEEAVGEEAENAPDNANEDSTPAPATNNAE